MAKSQDAVVVVVEDWNSPWSEDAPDTTGEDPGAPGTTGEDVAAGGGGGTTSLLSLNQMTDCIKESIDRILEDDGCYEVAYFLQELHDRGRITWIESSPQDEIDGAYAHIHWSWDRGELDARIHLNAEHISKNCTQAGSSYHYSGLRSEFDTTLAHEALHAVLQEGHTRDVNNDPLFDEVYEYSNEQNCGDRFYVHPSYGNCWDEENSLCDDGE